jgi:DNA mismatch endonuclease (patch repair protein)
MVVDAKRSEIMRAVKGRDTAPEMLVRRLLFGMGYRYRLHRTDLPGKPDLAFIGRRKVIFVHGCFWHGHDCARGARVPKQNADYWTGKIARNKARDMANLDKLDALGWGSLVIWECELKNTERLRQQLTTFLDG